MIRLPISGVQAQWRSGDGHDDIALADSRPGLAGALAYVSRCVEVVPGADASVAGDAVAVTAVAALPVGDLDLLVVARRRELRGDALVAEGRCERCHAQVDVQFSLAAYADHHRPHAARSVLAGADGWYRLRSSPEVSFRSPTVADVLAAADAADPRAALLARCARGPLTARAVRTIESALSVVAPTLRADVAGTCPECTAAVLLDVDARELCLSELRFLAASVYDDVHLIASVYRWSQDAILGLTSARRRRYADLIAGRVPAALAVPVA